MPAQKQAIEEFGIQRGVTLTPMVWVFFSKEEKYVGRIVHVSRRYDLAILKIDRSPAPFFRLSAAESPPHGAKVMACGFPEATRKPLSEEETLETLFRHARVDLARQTGKHVRVEDDIGGSDFGFVMTTGAVSRPVTEASGKWIQHDATIHGGNSGGPLLIAEDGTAVGINTLGIQGVGGGQWSLSLPQLRQEIDQHVPGAVWH